MKIVENLAFKGGGVLGAAYAGALTAFEEYRLVGHSGGTKPVVYGNVQRVAGTSAGSICAALVALGHNAAEINDLMGGLQFTEFVDPTANPLLDGGFCYGAAFLNWMEKRVAEVLGKPDATFADLAARAANDARFKDLHVFSHQVSGGRTFEFCAQSTPDVPIAQAVRASMSIPIFFVPWTFSGDLAKSYPGLFVDGGVAFNYPISAFDSGPGNNLTLGILLEQLSYEQQGLLDVAFHGALDALGAPQGVRTIAEALLEAVKIGPLDMTKIEALRSRARETAPQGGNDLMLAIEIVVAAALAWDIWRQSGDIAKTIEAFIAAVEQYLANSPAWQALVKFLNVVGRWFSIIGTIVNSPTNVVFERDAQRSVVVNTLGYSFVDFWMPDCNKRKLVDAGYNSARKYLSLIMYS